jgi:hypothetical protein
MATLNLIEPVCAKPAEPWDEVTWYNDRPSGASDKYVPVIGPYTQHPTGFTLEEVYKMRFRIKNFKFYYDVSGVLVIQADTTGDISVEEENFNFTFQTTERGENIIIDPEGANDGLFFAVDLNIFNGDLYSANLFNGAENESNLACNNFQVGFNSFHTEGGTIEIFYFVNPYTLLKNDNLFYPRIETRLAYDLIGGGSLFPSTSIASRTLFEEGFYYWYTFPDDFSVYIKFDIKKEENAVSFFGKNIPIYYAGNIVEQTGFAVEGGIAFPFAEATYAKINEMNIEPSEEDGYWEYDPEDGEGPLYEKDTGEKIRASP